MNYQEENAKRHKGKKKIFRWVVLFIALVVAALCVFSAFYPAASWKYYFDLPAVSARGEGELRIHYLDALHGDATLIECPDGKNILVGGGADDESSRENILRFLNALQIKKLDSIVATGVSRDQNGVFLQVLQFYEVGGVWLPAESNGQSGAYADFVAEVGRKGLDYHIAQRGDTLFESGQGSIKFLYPSVGGSVEATVLFVEYSGVSALVGGDLSDATLQYLKSERTLGGFEKQGIDLTKAHIVKVERSVDNEALRSFLFEFGVETAVVSCREGNSYEPDEARMQAVLEEALQAFRTDKNGHISFALKDGRYTVAAQK